MAAVKTADSLIWLAGPDGVRMEGAMTLNTLGPHWLPLLDAARRAPPGRVFAVDFSAVTACDATGFALLREMERACKATGVRFGVQGMAEPLQRVYAFIHPPADVVEESSTRITLSLPALVGYNAVHLVQDARMQVGFIGEIICGFWALLRRRARFPFKIVVNVMDQAGVNAIPIVSAIGLLLGLILAFQMMNPLKQFGADIYVIYMVTVAMFRELGPLITAILIAARTGSAFAAELGTMKVNEEVDALTTMGLDPVRFLVLGRVLGVACVMPVLVLLADACGVIGAGAVALIEGYPFSQVYRLAVQAAHLNDLFGGLFKGAVFGAVVASVGCQRGLHTGFGASAVGTSTTSAVVSGIFLIAMLDGLFSILFYALGI